MRFLKDRPNLYAACIICFGVLCILMLRVVLKLSKQDVIPLQVIALSTPLASLASDIGDRHVQVQVLDRDSTDVVMQRTLLRHADVIIGIGAMQDGWILPLIEEEGRRADYVELLHFAPTLTMPDGKTNPYVWYGPSQVKVLGKVIRDVLTQKDMVNGGDYHVRAHVLAQEMEQMEEQMDTAFRDKDGIGLILFHQGFQYFFHDTPLGDNVYLISEENLSTLGLSRMLGLATFVSGYAKLYVFAPVHVPSDILTLLRQTLQIELRFIPSTTVANEKGGVVRMLQSSLGFVQDAL